MFVCVKSVCLFEKNGSCQTDREWFPYSFNRSDFENNFCILQQSIEKIRIGWWNIKMPLENRTIANYSYWNILQQSYFHDNHTFLRIGYIM